MRIGEMLLGALSRDPSRIEQSSSLAHHQPGHELSRLRLAFPDLSSLVREKRVVDFGCGAGLQAVALALEEQCEVIGIDCNAKALASANSNAEKYSVCDRVRFEQTPSLDLLSNCDVVISQDAMEHYPSPETTLQEMSALLKPGGKVLLTFGPPWWAPYGAHMHFFTKVPWVNLLFSEPTVMSVRSKYRSDGAKRYEEVESGLNRMSIGKFEKLTKRSGLTVERLDYRVIKNQNWLKSFPLIRELLINDVVCILSK